MAHDELALTVDWSPRGRDSVLSSRATRPSTRQVAGYPSSYLAADRPRIELEALRALRRSRLCEGMSDTEIQYLASVVHLVTVAAGTTVCRQDELGDQMYIVAAGRVKVTSGQTHEETVLAYLGQGEHFGEMAMLTDGRRIATVEAVMDTQLLEVDRDAFQWLLATVPGFSANISRTLGHRLRGQTRGSHRQHGPKVVGLVATSAAARRLARPLAEALAEAGDRVHVLLDGRAVHSHSDRCQIESLPPIEAQWARSVRARLVQLVAQNDRVIVELASERPDRVLLETLKQCEQVWWLVDSRDPVEARRRLDQLLRNEPALGRRVHWVWLLREHEKFAPLMPTGIPIADRDFKVVLGDHLDLRHERHSLNRLVRQIRGPRLGIALGGGGARGLAHLGVLRAFERAGIDFDVMAGTSAGALVGSSYAAGLSPEEALQDFHRDLTPPRLFRWLPRGPHWYMLLQFRLGAWDQMLRKYLGVHRLEQLRLPLSTVTVDLISGQTVVRDRGDVVDSVLESINLPVVSHPILRDGMALVDGGILNNVPTDLLRPRGADIVVGVDVAATVARRFGARGTDGNARAIRRPGLFETMIRINEVLDHAVNRQPTKGADVLIRVNTGDFEFADFTAARRLAEVGEEAAEQAIAGLEQQIRNWHGGSARPAG